MATFTDVTEEKWSFELLRPDIKRVEQELGINLLRMGEPELLHKLLEDPETIIDVVSVILSPEIERRYKIAQVGEPVEKWFAKRMKGDALDRASDALLEEIVNFFPIRRQGPLKLALQKTREILEIRQTGAMEMLASGKLEMLVRKEMTAHSENIESQLNEHGNTSSSLVDTSELTRTE